jgi:hypothetical protein
MIDRSEGVAAPGGHGATPDRADTTLAQRPVCGHRPAWAIDGAAGR